MRLSSSASWPRRTTPFHTPRSDASRISRNTSRAYHSRSLARAVLVISRSVAGPPGRLEVPVPRAARQPDAVRAERAQAKANVLHLRASVPSSSRMMPSTDTSISSQGWRASSAGDQSTTETNGAPSSPWRSARRKAGRSHPRPDRPRPSRGRRRSPARRRRGLASRTAQPSAIDRRKPSGPPPGPCRSLPYARRRPIHDQMMPRGRGTGKPVRTPAGPNPGPPSLGRDPRSSTTSQSAGASAARRRLDGRWVLSPRTP